MRNKLKNAIWFLTCCMASFIVGLVAPTGCQTTPPVFNIPDEISDTAIIYSEDLIWYERMWSREARRRYPNAILLMSHGFDNNGEWWCDYTGLQWILVEDLVKLTREQYPVRRIVLVICNPGGYTLTLSNVSYPLEDIWLIPDRDMNSRSTVIPNASGNIYEMQEN